MIHSFSWQRELSREGHRVFFSGQPFAMHCHHYNINLQKTLEDTLGQEGVALLYHSVERAAYHTFGYLLARYSKLTTLRSKLDMATILFQNCGLGILHFQDIGLEGGQAVSPSSHHVTGWLAKHGRRETPGCHFTRGWLAGVLETIFGQSLNAYQVQESACKLMRHPECVFLIRPTGAQPTSASQPKAGAGASGDGHGH
jgi:hypothetical protein